MKTPILRNGELEKLRQVDSSVFSSRTLDITWPVAEGRRARGRRRPRLHRGERGARRRHQRPDPLRLRAGPSAAPIPSLLAVGSVHHHLVREARACRPAWSLESGEPREVHHFATLIGFGASAINPYLMFESLAELVQDGRVPGVEDVALAETNVVKGIAKGLLKTISKMGISTIQSYNGAQIFEAVGLGPDDRPRVRGHRLAHRRDRDRRARRRDAAEARQGVSGTRPRRCCPSAASTRGAARASTTCGTRRRSRSCSTRSATAAGPPTRSTGNSSTTTRPRATLRGLLRFRSVRGPVVAAGRDRARLGDRAALRDRRDVARLALARGARDARDRDEPDRRQVEHGRGRGGRLRYTRDPNDDSRRSAIKQVASGRFGVNINYLVNADELQIKMAQGAKPGEGGQLPGHKVDRYIGSIRFTTPGVGLISPPPHHDIYSIEDLKQLIYDLRCGNPRARISVKLVSEVGVGTVAGGRREGQPDHVLIAGHEGGTGASPLSSIQSAGVPWEIGLAETQQTLVLNDLRSRIWLQTDGQLKTGRDVVIAALLGADEMGFSTAR